MLLMTVGRDDIFLRATYILLSIHAHHLIAHALHRDPEEVVDGVMVKLLLLIAVDAGQAAKRGIPHVEMALAGVAE